MGTLVQIHPADEGVPVRPDHYSVLTPLVSVFRFDREMLPFVRYLLDEHGIFNVRDWDAASSRVFDGFALSDDLKARFKQRVGRPKRSQTSAVGNVTSM